MPYVKKNNCTIHEETVPKYDENQENNELSDPHECLDLAFKNGKDYWDFVNTQYPSHSGIFGPPTSFGAVGCNQEFINSKDDRNPSEFAYRVYAFI